MSDRKQKASLKSQAHQAATTKAAAQEAYRQMRQRETASNVRTQIGRQGKEAVAARRKERAAQKARDALEQAGATKGPQFEPITKQEAVDGQGKSLPGAGGFSNGNGNGDLEKPASWWSSQPDWLRLLLLAGGGYVIYRQVR